MKLGEARAIARGGWASKPSLGDSSTIHSRDARVLKRVRDRERGRRRAMLAGDERGNTLDCWEDRRQNV